MQWLIDILIANLPPIHKYHNRGDPATPDFQVGDLLKDNAWHTLDLSGIIPADSTLAHLRVTLQAPSTTKTLALRGCGVVQFPNVAYSLLQVGSKIIAADKHICLNPAREIEYKLSTSPITAVQITVAGWWGPNP